MGGAMRRVLTAILCAGALVAGARGIQAQGDGGYKLVPNWPKLPPGMYFGLKDAPPPPSERDAQAAARRTRAGSTGQNAPAGSTSSPQAGGPTKHPGVSGPG